MPADVSRARNARKRPLSLKARLEQQIAAAYAVGAWHRLHGLMQVVNVLDPGAAGPLKSRAIVACLDSNRQRQALVWLLRAWLREGRAWNAEDARQWLVQQGRHALKRVLASGRAPAPAVFDAIYKLGGWGALPTVSGPGSTLAASAWVRSALPDLLRDLGVRRLLDVPCGDFYWLRHCDLDLDTYVGGDIVPDLIARVDRDHGGPGRTFMVLDMLADPLPAADLLLCRDLLIHFSLADCFVAFKAMRDSGIPHFLITSAPEAAENTDIVTGGFRPTNLEKQPFNLPPPRRIIRDNNNKILGLWFREDLPG